MGSGKLNETYCNGNGEIDDVICFSVSVSVSVSDLIVFFFLKKNKGWLQYDI